jgi:hypothetical protein
MADSVRGPGAGTPDPGLLDLEDALRRRLGLREDEGLRLIEVTRTSVVLERWHPDDATPRLGLPALRADVGTLPLADVLGAVHASGKSGLLTFRYRDHEKSIWFHRGEVVFANSNQRVDRLGECLLRAGVINLEQLREAERCFQPPERFGKVLVERGFLTPRELWNGVKYQVEEIVRSLFSYPGGITCFWEGDLQPDNVVRLALATSRLVEEGIQRRDELRRFLAVLEDPRVRLATAPHFRAPLAGNERALVDAIGSERAFSAVCEALDFDRESAARSIQLLRLVGAVRVLRSESRPGFLSEADLDAPDDAALRARVRRLTKLVAELTGAIAAVEGPAGIQDRLARVLDDVTGRFPALLTGVGLGAGGGLDPELLADRATKLPGDREEQLVNALAELVAYLEFEVKNHPAIDDPDRLLGGLGDLREALAGR